MASNEAAFQTALKACDKVFQGLPLRIVFAVIEQAAVDAVLQVKPDMRAKVIDALFDAIRKRVVDPGVVVRASPE